MLAVELGALLQSSRTRAN